MRVFVFTPYPIDRLPLTVARSGDFFPRARAPRPPLIPVAALYVDPKGPYIDLPGVDPWIAERDARLYTGPNPVVAHPPCGPWGRLKHLCKYQLASLGIYGVSQVRTWGGVLEHPKDSTLWKACRLPRPGEPPDAWGGYTITVRQCDWGHRAAKPTWLYIVGVPRNEVDDQREPRQPTHKVTNNDRLGMAQLKRLGALECRLTPPEFAQWLIGIARRATRPQRIAA